MTQNEQVLEDQLKEGIQALYGLYSDSETRKIYGLVMRTDTFSVFEIGEDNVIPEVDRILQNGLEIRLFCERGEIKWFRTNIGEEKFRKRERLQDTKLQEKIDYMDQEQYLDIDTKHVKKQENGYQVQATGGGSYFLPWQECEDATLKIRNYLGYEEDTGRVFVKDWRIVGFGNNTSVEKEKEEN